MQNTQNQEVGVKGRNLGKQLRESWLNFCSAKRIIVISWFQGQISGILGFPDSSVGKESSCNAGDPGSISGSGRSAGEGIGYPLQYSWASLVAQLVKNPPTMWETGVRSMVWEDTLQKGKATHPSILAWRIPWTIQSMEFSRPEYWSGQPFPSPGDLPN